MSQKSPLSPVMLVMVMCLAEILGMAAFATFPTLIPTFQQEWSLTNTEAGWIGGIYFGGYVVAVGVLTALTDRVDPKQVYILSMMLGVIGAVGFALSAQGVWSATFWRCLQGIGLAGTYMPGLKALTDVVPERVQSRTVAFYTSSFGLGTSLSIYLSGAVEQAAGWQWAFGICAVGPLFALLLVAWVLPGQRPSKAQHDTRLLDFRPVFANRRAFRFTLAYAAHNAELFGFRTWIVAFLIFSQSLQPEGMWGVAWSAATIAALVNLLSLPCSVTGNEIARYIGRERTLFVIMSSSAVIAVLTGFSVDAAFWIVVCMVVLYGVTVIADSATITAGVVEAADPRYRGATMAVHSLIGFIGSFIGPIVFGFVLDISGGANSSTAWGWAFTSMAILVLLGPLAIKGLARKNQ